MKEAILLFMAFMLVCLLPADAQRHEVLSPQIRSLQVVAGDRWMDMPIIELGGDEVINISFDDLTHEYRRMEYRIEHCEADWTVSEEIFESDWLEGFNERPLENLEQSINTTVLYTHYNVQFPNEDTQMLIGGNYRVTISDVVTGHELLTACFMVVDPIMQVGLSVTTNTDVEVNRTKQQVCASVNYRDLRVTNIDQQLTTVFLQNQRWDNAVWNPRPDFQLPDGARWQHCRDLIFDGGNTYRKYEVLDLHHATLGVDSMRWDGERNHAYLYTAEPRRSYTYDEAPQGSFYLRNSDNINNDTESDYVWVHYALSTDAIPHSSSIYVNGTWTNGQLVPQYQLMYNDATGLFEASIMQKQGYYSYNYLLMDASGSITYLPSEGNFFETQNKYTALVYYRGIGERTDRLVAVKEI